MSSKSCVCSVEMQGVLSNAFHSALTDLSYGGDAIFVSRREILLLTLTLSFIHLAGTEFQHIFSRLLQLWLTNLMQKESGWYLRVITPTRSFSIFHV